MDRQRCRLRNGWMDGWIIEREKERGRKGREGRKGAL